MVKQPWSPWPKNPWLKAVGAHMLAGAQSALEAYSLALFTRYGGMTGAEATAVCEEATRSIVCNRKMHIYTVVYAIAPWTFDVDVDNQLVILGTMRLAGKRCSRCEVSGTRSGGNGIELYILT